ncbi:MAG: DUF2924 domain-containing protein [Rickettsiales bacterium]|nr:DUF2924 domain-containing protein [Rickettsiales bacterium]
MFEKVKNNSDYNKNCNRHNNNYNVYNSNGSNGNSNSNNSTNLQRQLFNLNNLSINELRLKWSELYNNIPTNFKRGFLIKGIAYRMQVLAGGSNTTESEVNLAIKVAKEKLKIYSSGTLNRKVNLIPPSGSVIKTFYKNEEYFVKVIDDGMGSINNINGGINSNETKFEYKGQIYKSLSAIATEIAGTRWNGYTFFKLKKTIKNIKKLNVKEIKD